MDVTSEVASPERDAARSRLLTVLEQALRLLHPFMPYITEELWQRLPGVDERLLHPAYAGAQPTVMLTQYPQARGELINERAEWEMQMVIDLIKRVRNIRSEMNIKPSVAVPLLISSADEKLREVFDSNKEQIRRLARVSEIIPTERPQAPPSSATAVLSSDVEIAVPLIGLIDFAQERARREREREKLLNEFERLGIQLANKKFTDRAPAEKVQEVKDRLNELSLLIKAITQSLEALK
jgi:valyl-tRNA synthetase